MLKADWFVADSMRDTLHNLVAAGDITYLKTVPPAEFERLLLREIRFVAPTAEACQAMEQYTQQHIGELYHFMQALTHQV